MLQLGSIEGDHLTAAIQINSAYQLVVYAFDQHNSYYGKALF